MSGAALLTPHVDEECFEQLIGEATHKSKREVEKLLATHFPKPDIAPSIRKLPAPQSKRRSRVDDALFPEQAVSSSEESAEVLFPALASPPSFASSDTPRDDVVPLSARSFKVQFTANEALKNKIEKAQALLGPSLSRNDLAELFSRALDVLVRELENKKHGITERPRKRGKSNSKSATRSRNIPRSVRREVYERDQAQCTYVDARGHRCQERSGLEYHHEIPFGRGGGHNASNIYLRCKAHNLHAAERDYGRDKMARAIGREVRESRGFYSYSKGGPSFFNWPRGKSGHTLQKPSSRVNAPPFFGSG